MNKMILGVVLVSTQPPTILSTKPLFLRLMTLPLGLFPPYIDQLIQRLSSIKGGLALKFPPSRHLAINTSTRQLNLSRIFSDFFYFYLLRSTVRFLFLILEVELLFDCRSRFYIFIIFFRDLSSDSYSLLRSFYLSLWHKSTFRNTNNINLNLSPLSKFILLLRFANTD